jgi:hypothetical protein
MMSRHWKISTGRHFQNGCHNTTQIKHCPFSTTFHMWVDYDVPNWFLTSKNFYRSPFSKWPPQYRKKSSSEFVTMQSVHLNLLWVAGLGDFIIVSCYLEYYSETCLNWTFWGSAFVFWE